MHSKLFASSPDSAPNRSPMAPNPPTPQTNTKVLPPLSGVNSTCHAISYNFIPEAEQIFSLGWWREEWGWGGVEEAGKALSLSFCLTLWCELIRPSELSWAHSRFYQGETSVGGCGWRGQGWTAVAVGGTWPAFHSPHMLELLRAGLACCSSSRPQHPQGLDMKNIC